MLVFGGWVALPGDFFRGNDTPKNEVICPHIWRSSNFPPHLIFVSLCNPSFSLLHFRENGSVICPHIRFFQVPAEVSIPSPGGANSAATFGGRNLLPHLGAESLPLPPHPPSRPLMARAELDSLPLELAGEWGGGSWLKRRRAG